MEETALPTVSASDPSIDVILRDAVSAYERAFDDIGRNWGAVDTKAQGTVTIAGVFIAAALALVKDKLNAMPDWALVVLFVTIVLLIATVVAAVLALRIRDTEDPLGGHFIENIARDADSRMKQRPDLVRGYLEEVCIKWRDIIERLDKDHELKVKRLHVAQMSLTAAIIAAGCLALGQIIVRH